MYQFDKKIQRRGTNCVKWDYPFIEEDTIPMWIADMDFQVAPSITENLIKAASQEAFGYKFLSEDYYEAVSDWMQRKHGYKVEREEICFVPNVVVGLSLAVQTVCAPGDEIIVQTPVYGPFYNVVRDNNCILKESPLKNDNGYYTMDLENFKRQITPRTKAVLICNPHNPSGRVWSGDELEKLAEICIRYNLYIISDDIHCELIAKGYKHTFISSLSEKVRKLCIVCTSPSKAFNLASIQAANCFIADPLIRERFQEKAENLHVADCNAFAEAAVRGAYAEKASEKWLDELNEYIDGNTEYFVNTIHENFPDLTVCRPEGTYLVWVDFRKTGIPQEKLREYMLRECHIAVNDGTFFGDEGKGFLRFNLACPRDRIEKALENMRGKF